MCTHFVLCLCTPPLALKKGFFARRAMKVIAFGVEAAKRWRVYRAGRGCHFFRAPQPCLFVLFITARNPHGQSPLCTLASDAESEARGSQNLPTMSQKCDLWIRQIICCFFPTLGANTKGLAMEDYNHGQKKIPKPKMDSCWAEPGSTSTPTPAIPRLTLGRQRLPWAWAAIYNS